MPVLLASLSRWLAGLLARTLAPCVLGLSHLGAPCSSARRTEKLAARPPRLAQPHPRRRRCGSRATSGAGPARLSARRGRRTAQTATIACAARTGRPQPGPSVNLGGHSYWSTLHRRISETATRKMPLVALGSSAATKGFTTTLQQCCSVRQRVPHQHHVLSQVSVNTAAVVMISQYSDVCRRRYHRRLCIPVSRQRLSVSEPSQMREPTRGLFK